MIRIKSLLSVFLVLFFASDTINAQITSLADAQGLAAGTYTFNFGNVDFEGYVDEAGWLLWLQHHHAGGTNSFLEVKGDCRELIYDDSQTWN